MGSGLGGLQSMDEGLGTRGKYESAWPLAGRGVPEVKKD